MAHEPFEHVLGGEAAQLHLGRQRRRDLHHAAIEQRHAHLQRAGHRRAVDPLQHALREIALEIQIKDAVQPRRGRRRRRQPLPLGVRWTVREPGERVRCEQLTLLGGREGARPHGMARVETEVGAGHEALEVDRGHSSDRRASHRPRDARHPRPRVRDPVRSIGRISAEHLVAAIAGQRDRDRLAREARQKIGRQDRGVTQRLVDEVAEGLHEVQRRIGAEDVLVMFGIEDGRHAPRVFRLVERAVVEAERERAEAAHVTAREHRDDARVEPARQEHAERHVGKQVLADGEVEHRAQPRRGLHFHHRRGAVVAHVPPALHASLAPRVDQPMPWRKLPYGLQNGPRRRHPVVREVRGQRVDVELAGNAGVLEHRFQL